MADAAFTRLGWKSPTATLAAAVALLALAGAARAQVQVQTLAPPDLFSVGVGKSDLSPDLWRGSSGALARAAIPTLATRPMTPAATALARKLLSAGASGPDGAGDDLDLAAARLSALLALGNAGSVESIADRTPNLAQKPALAQVAAEAALVRGEDDKACGIETSLTDGRDGAYWLRLRAYCQAKAGQAPSAQLTLSLAEQQGRHADYERLMNAMLAGGDPGVPVLDDGLDYALSRRLSPNGWVQAMPTASAAVAVAVARDATAPATARVEAAARAVRLGLPVPEAYVGLTPPADIAAANQLGPTGEAMLMALAGATTDLTLKQAALAALLKRAQSQDEFQALSRLAAPGIASLVQANAVFGEPPVFAAACAVAGDGACAKAVRAQVGADAPPLGLALLDALIAASAGSPDSAVVQAVDAAGRGSDSAGAQRAAGALALLGALGAPVDAQGRFDLDLADLGPGRIPTGRQRALELSAAGGHAGDVALYVLITAAEAGPAGPSVGDRAALVRALDQAGLKTEARAYAVEGLLAIQARP